MVHPTHVFATEWVTETPRSRVSFASTVLLNPVGSLRLSHAQKPSRPDGVAMIRVPATE